MAHGRSLIEASGQEGIGMAAIGISDLRAGDRNEGAKQTRENAHLTSGLTL